MDQTLHNIGAASDLLAVCLILSTASLFPKVRAFFVEIFDLEELLARATLGVETETWAADLKAKDKAFTKIVQEQLYVVLTSFSASLLFVLLVFVSDYAVHFESPKAGQWAAPWHKWAVGLYFFGIACTVILVRIGDRIDLLWFVLAILGSLGLSAVSQWLIAEHVLRAMYAILQSSQVTLIFVAIAALPHFIVALVFFCQKCWLKWEVDQMS